MQIEISGKKVVLKETIPLSEGYDLLGLILASSNQDIRTSVPVIARTIESWEFDGDPSDEESYDNLDVVSIVIPLARVVNSYLNRKMSTAVVTDESEPEKN